MGRSRRPARFGLHLALACAAGLSACAERRPRTADVSFPPGKHVGRHDGLRVELLHATYDELGVSVRIGLHNGGEQPIAIDRRGILLEHEGLEFPIAGDPVPTIAPRTELPPDGKTQLEARFTLGHRLEGPGVIRLRAIERGDHWIEGARVGLPAGFDATGDDDNETKTRR